jgi:hypothetical protein
MKKKEASAGNKSILRDNVRKAMCLVRLFREKKVLEKTRQKLRISKY